MPSSPGPTLIPPSKFVMSTPTTTPPSFWERARSYIYDKAIVSITTKWYTKVLHHLPENSHILDVGIGTGAALIANAALLRAKEITVVGVDYDSAYVTTCHRAITEAGLERYVTVEQADIYEYMPSGNRLFDHVYFSGSFMIMERKEDVLKKIVELLVDREVGRLYFTQTFELQKNRWMEWVKPKLRSLTSIDFGNVSYEGDFEDALHGGECVIESVEVIEDGARVDDVREARVVVARSRLYVPVGTETMA